MSTMGAAIGFLHALFQQQNLSRVFTSIDGIISGDDYGEDVS